MITIRKFTLLFAISVLVWGLVFPVSVFARQRGSVRSANRSGGSWSNPRSSGTTTRSYSGDSASRTTQVQGRYGGSATQSKNVSREGDTVTVDKNLQTSSGASKSTSKEYEFDDRRVESVSRDTQATDRYGRTASYEGKAERSGYGWEFEGEGKNRYGQKTEVEGYGARGYYGTGVVADVEGGRYGDRTVVAGKPYGGRAWSTSLPYGARPYNYHGYNYYYHGGYYYRPYYYHGAHYYCYAWPPYGVYYDDPPVGAIFLVVAGMSLMYSNGSYYQTTSAEGTTKYEVVAPPAGASLPGTALPADRASVTVGGVKYYFYGNTFYKRVVTDGKESFVVITKPAGVLIVKALPAEFEPMPVGNLTYFKANSRYYLSYLDPSTAEELYIVVDPPATAQVQQQSTKTASQTQTAKSAAQPQQTEKAQTQAPPPPKVQTVHLTVAPDTKVAMRISSTLSSETAKPGLRFQGSLDRDLIVDGRLVAARGSRIYGRVVDAKSGTGMGGDPMLSLELTDIVISDHAYAIGTDPLQMKGEGKSPAKKILGGAALGAGIGAIVDGGEGAAWGATIGGATGTAVAAASEGNQIAEAEGTSLEFRIARPFTVSVMVPASS